jgi:hypothetical protein
MAVDTFAAVRARKHASSSLSDTSPMSSCSHICRRVSLTGRMWPQRGWAIACAFLSCGSSGGLWTQQGRKTEGLEESGVLPNGMKLTVGPPLAARPAAYPECWASTRGAR